MSMSADPGLLGEGDLHGLVDGNLEPDRRAGALRKLAASPADRAQVEAWQEQNDLIRAAFRDVEYEALPVALDLAPPRLRCVESDVDREMAPLRAPPREPRAARRRNALAGAVTLLVVTVGMAGAWLIGQGRGDEAANAVPVAGLEATLAAQATSALEGGNVQTRVPDLSPVGLRLTDVSSQPGEPNSMILHYRDAGDERVVLGLADAADGSPGPAISVGKTIAWRRGGTAYALAGTVPAERLRKLARFLQHETGQD